MQNLDILLAFDASKIPDMINGWLSVFPPGVAKWLTAILIFIVGGFIAKSLGKLTSKALGKTDLDNKLVSKLGGENLGIEKLLGSIVYGVLMLYVIAIALDAAGLQSVTEPITDMLSKILGYIPNVLGAGVILFIGFLIAKIVRQLLEGAMEAGRVDQRLKRPG